MKDNTDETKDKANRWKDGQCFWKNQYLQIQSNPYQITNGIFSPHRTRMTFEFSKQHMIQ